MRKPQESLRYPLAAEAMSPDRAFEAPEAARLIAAVGGFLRLSSGTKRPVLQGYLENRERKPLSPTHVFSPRPRVRTRARGHFGGFLPRPREGVPFMDNPFCFYCRFFAPDDAGHGKAAPGQWDECMEGECRRDTPRLGDLLVDRCGDAFRHFGQWPKVMAGDWCGRFEPRQDATRDSGARTRHVGPRSNASCGVEQGCARAGVCRHVAEHQSGQDGQAAAIGTPPPRAS